MKGKHDDPKSMGFSETALRQTFVAIQVYLRK